jgi:16S rRNA G527 N7-methylase RsmG
LDSSDVTKLVATGYDQIADSYLQQSGHSAVRARKLNELADLLPARAHVLDLGCGAGVPGLRLRCSDGILLNNAYPA